MSWWTRLVRRVPGAVPDSDVAVLGWSRDRFLLTRVTTTIGYAAAGPALATLSGLLDLGLPLAVPAVFTLAGALLGWTGAARSVRARAEDAREELRFALVSFLQQAGLLRQGGAGVATALSLPARLLADGWAMRRIADELAIAERAGQMPWEGLRRFGEQVGVDELTDLSAIAAGAGQDGAAVVDTLLKRAESLRDELLADEHADRPPRQRTDEHTRRPAGVPHRDLGALPGRRRPALLLTTQSSSNPDTFDARKGETDDKDQQLADRRDAVAAAPCGAGRRTRRRPQHRRGLPHRRRGGDRRNDRRGRRSVHREEARRTRLARWTPHRTPGSAVEGSASRWR